MKREDTPGERKAADQTMQFNEVLGKRRACSPNSGSECPLENKKSRSESPKVDENIVALMMDENIIGLSSD
uniref:Uncharacterized protein n=1 Tax=Sphaerodactylus townsendi TaxID=933632 RepID=A0ACB8EEN6_9SAUR